MPVVAPFLGFSVYQCYMSTISFINPVGKGTERELRYLYPASHGIKSVYVMSKVYR